MEKHLTQFNYPSCTCDSREDLVPCLGVVHSKHLGQKLMKASKNPIKGVGVFLTKKSAEEKLINDI